jgi:hypothetical protein
MGVAGPWWAFWRRVCFARTLAPLDPGRDLIDRVEAKSAPDRGWSVLAGTSPLGKLSASEPLPCCSLVALWVREVCGMEPRPASTFAATLQDVAASDLDWWSQANIYEGWGPWAALDAARSRLGGTVAGPVRVDTHAPPLLPGRWHVVQRWAHGSGHTYLVRADESGTRCTVVQSSTSLGYRVSRGAWVGAAGLAGYDVSVLTIPSLVEAP